VKVKSIVNMMVRGLASIETAQAQYDLSSSEIHAALAYYYDNKSAFDLEYHEDEALLENLASPVEAHLQQLRDRKT
jgi:N-acetyl-gamma-glutamylphosphate reductase